MQTSEIKRENIKAEDLRNLGQSAVDEEAVGKRIDMYLAKQFPFYTRSIWQKKIQSSEVFVNQLAPGKSSYRLQDGDKISMYYPRSVEPKVERELKCLFQTEGVMAISKPSGMPMHENGPYLKNTFSYMLREQYGEEWAAVHRIDRETSGVVICANTNELRASISKDLAKRQVQKTYCAIVFGEVESDSFSELSPLGEPPDGSEIRIKKWVNFESGLPSHTDFEVIERANGYTLIRASPRTGRTNQIRIHLAYNGHRIVGDKLYHPNEDVFLSYYDKKGKDWVDKMAGFERLCLHAEKIEFYHPGLDSVCIAECPMTPDLVQLWADIKKGRGGHRQSTTLPS